MRGLTWGLVMGSLPMLSGGGASAAPPGQANPAPIDQAAPAKIETATFALG